MKNLHLDQLIVASFRYYLPRRTVSTQRFARALKSDFDELDLVVKDSIKDFYSLSKCDVHLVGVKEWWTWLD